MAKDILLYGTILEYNAMFFHDQIAKAVEKDAKAAMTLRINCEGGSPDYGMSVIEKVQEMAEQFSVKVGAMAHSMGLFILCYVPVDKVECIDTTQAVLHRAAYPSYIETQTSFPGGIYQQMLVKTNKDLEKAFRARVDVNILESLPQFKDKQITLKDIFSLDSRLEILLTAADLKAIGLVSKINKITPSKSAEMQKLTASFKKCISLDEFKIAAQITDDPIQKPVKETKTKIMTLKELKAQFPAIYAQAKAEGHAEGIAAEKDRVESILVFNELDPAGCKAAIESGKALTAKQQSEFALKSFSKEALAKISKDSAKDVTTETVDTPKTEKEKNLETFEGKLTAELGLKKK